MKATRTLNWTARNGKKIEVRMEMIREVEDNISYADGWNVNLGKKTTEHLSIEVYADGKYQTRSFHPPHTLDPLTSGKERYEKLTAAGAYARLGDSYINKDQYNNIMAALEELNTELAPDAEFAEIKAQEVAKEVAREKADRKRMEQYEKEVKNGLCLKCGTYCYGDCEAH